MREREREKERRRESKQNCALPDPFVYKLARWRDLKMKGRIKTKTTQRRLLGWDFHKRETTRQEAEHHR